MRWQRSILAFVTIQAAVPLFYRLAYAADQPVPPAYPLKVSANRRYLVDQNNVPFLIAGDSQQSLMVNLSEEDAEAYFADRQAHGFNTVWINLLCKPYTGGRPDGTTYADTHIFIPPRHNADGDDDWVLILEARKNNF